MRHISPGILKCVILGQMAIIVCLSVMKYTTDRATCTLKFQDHLAEAKIFDKSDEPKSDKDTQEAMNATVSIRDVIMSKSHLTANTTALSSPTNMLEINNQSRKLREQEEQMKARLIKIREKCASYMQKPYWQNLKLVGKCWTYKPDVNKINYCVIPKVGCTFWKRVMRFLGKAFPKNANVKKPSDIDRTYVHSNNKEGILEINMNNPIARMLMTNGTSFMFARDPFSRLWSAYVDKFLLPGFWNLYGLEIVKRTRPKASEYEKKCAHNVTFREFLLFIKMTYKDGLTNEHWQYMHQLCSPCHVQYDVIGKLETFGNDADFLFTKLKLQYLEEKNNIFDKVRVEVTGITQFNFDLEPSIGKGCFDKMDIAKRLWLAFQYNGYIDRNSKFPENDLKKREFYKFPATIFMDHVFKTIENQNINGIDIKSQKRAMMLEEYKRIPKDLFNAIIKIYEYDFELFDYNKQLFS